MASCHDGTGVLGVLLPTARGLIVSRVRYAIGEFGQVCSVPTGLRFRRGGGAYGVALVGGIGCGVVWTRAHTIFGEVWTWQGAIGGSRFGVIRLLGKIWCGASSALAPARGAVKLLDSYMGFHLTATDRG